MFANLIVRVPAVMDHTDQVGPVQWVGLPPLTPGRLVGLQGCVGLQAELDPLPLVVTLPLQYGPVLQVVPVGVGPGDLRAVAGVRAGDHVGALGPGGGVVELSLGVAFHQSSRVCVGLIGGALLHVVPVLAGVGDVPGDIDQGVVPAEVVVGSV